MGLPWVPLQLERTLRRRDAGGKVVGVAFADVVHGALIIEYEPPRSLRGRGSHNRVRHAQEQAEDYAVLMAREEGRPVEDYTLVVWDGAIFAAGRMQDGKGRWDRATSFGIDQAKYLLDKLATQGRPFIHPRILNVIAGPDSVVGQTLIPRLFEVIVNAERKYYTTKNRILFHEWNTYSDKLQA